MKVKEKNKKKEKSKSPPKKDSSPKDNKNKVISKSSRVLQKSDKFPKNANEFKHIMDDVRCGVPDIEYMLQLRRYKKILNINKNISGNSPSFYDDDLEKYRKKTTKKLDEKQLLQTNIGKFRQIFSDRTKYAINDTQYKYEITLRADSLIGSKKSTKNQENNQKQNINIRNKIRWNPTLIPRSRSLFDTILPPILSRSKELFSRIDDRIGRPVIKLNKDGYINGEKVKSRVFEFNKNYALRYPSEHFPSSRYINDYGIQNIGTIKHLLNFDNRTMTSNWITYLRGPRKIKFLPEETKRREKRLRDRSHEKSYPKD